MTGQPLPTAFVERIESQLGDEASSLLTALDRSPSLSVRLNPGKSTAAFSGNTQVPWHPHGRYLDERPSFTLDPLFHAGAYYVQEASSMFLAEAFRQCVGDRSNLHVLDLCAAPGGKSTLLLSELDDSSLLVANEVIRSRASILAENVTKWGRANVVVTNSDPREFDKLPEFFDVIAVDAPCSGEGLFRKDLKARSEWSPENVALCAARQQRILDDVLQALAPGGVLFYSTCTYAPEEDEANVRWLQEQGLELVNLELNPDWGIAETEFGLHFYPHQLRGEGFFFAALRKPGARPEELAGKRKRTLTRVSHAIAGQVNPWLNAANEFVLTERNNEVYAVLAELEQSVVTVASRLRVVQLGVHAGKPAKRDWVPGHGLAVSGLLNNDCAAIEVSEAEALQFLRKETLPAALAQGQSGWLLVRYQGLGLGWVKALPNRLNNYYPKEWRIRMR